VEEADPLRTLRWWKRLMAEAQENMIRPGQDEAVRGLVFNIQKFSLHDGSGIRTLVFLKGCPLICRWCSNPEGQAYTPELAYRPDRCIGASECDRCRAVCEVDAIRIGEDGRVEVDREMCTDCGRCVDACPSNALELFGRWMSVADLLRVVEEDSSFYARSGGGVTLSGGEPLAQTEFVLAFLNKARTRGLDTALETSGLCKWEDLERVCRLVNHVFFDVKSLDRGKHEEGAGVGNERILENLRRLREAFPELPLTVRTPIVPGFNDGPEDVQAIAAFLDRLPGGPVDYELLPYHRFGESKYDQLGKAYPLQGLEPPPKEQIEDLRKLLEG
jgi:pyruvate formate lyase activating enzyme